MLTAVETLGEEDRTRGITEGETIEWRESPETPADDEALTKLLIFKLGFLFSCIPI